MFLNDLVASYLFKKAEIILNWTTYHGIYHDDSLVVEFHMHFGSEVNPAVEP